MESNQNSDDFRFGFTGSSRSGFSAMSGLSGIDPRTTGASPYNTDPSLQLAPIYSNPRHQQQMESIGDILSRYEGRSRATFDDSFDDNYEENVETHMDFNEHGAHLGVRMSRTQQTPFGNARTQVGVRMSIGYSGMSIRTSGMASLGTGNRGRMLMIGSSEGSRYRSPFRRSMLQPMEGMRSPFGSLFSPFGGRFSSELGQYRTNASEFGYDRQQRPPENVSTQSGSDGPIIEELFDEEETETQHIQDVTNDWSHKTVKEETTEEELSALGLGLLPDIELIDNDSDINKTEEMRRSVQFNETILNELTYTEALSSESRNIDLDEHMPKDRETVQGVTSEETMKEKQENCLENSSSKGSITEMNSDTAKLKNPSEQKADTKSTPKNRQKFTKQSFKNIPFKLEDNDSNVPFLHSSIEEIFNLDECQDESQFMSERGIPQNLEINENVSLTDAEEQKPNKNATPKMRNNYFSRAKIGDRTSCPEFLDWNVKNNTLSNESRQSHLQSYKHFTMLDEGTADEKKFACAQNQVTDKGLRKSATEAIERSVSPELFKYKLGTESSKQIYEPYGVDFGFPSMISPLSSDNDLFSTNTLQQSSNKTSEINKTSISEKPAFGAATEVNQVQPLSLDSYIFNDKGDETNAHEERTASPEVVNNQAYDDQSESEITNTQTNEVYLKKQRLNDSDQSCTEMNNGVPFNSMQISQRHFVSVGADMVKSDTTKPCEDSGTEDYHTSIEHDVGALELSVCGDNAKQTTFLNKGKLSKTWTAQATNTSIDVNKTAQTDKTSLDIGSEHDTHGIMFTSQQDEPAQWGNIPTTTFMSKDKRMTEAGDMCVVSHTPGNTDGSNAVHKNLHISDGTINYSSSREDSCQPLVEDNGPGNRARHDANGSISPQINSEVEYTTGKQIEPETLHESYTDLVGSGEAVEYHEFNDWQQNESEESSDNNSFSALYSPKRETSEDISTSMKEQKDHLGRELRRENVNSRLTSVNDEFCTGITWQYPGQGNQNGHHFHDIRKPACHASSDAAHEQYKGCEAQHICEGCLRKATCEHTHIHQVYKPCCQRSGYVCMECDGFFTPEEFSKLKHDANTDDLYQHPEWQFLNEYTHEHDTITKPNPIPAKRKVNKNAVVRSSGTSVTPGQPQQQSKVGSRDKRPSTCNNPTTDFGDLVASVGLEMKDVYPDGNCLFTSVCDQLRIRGDFSYTPRKLRHAAVDYLRLHPNQKDGTPLLAFLSDEERDWDKYLDSMRRDGHWGDHIVIWALTHVLKTRIVIYRGSTELYKTVVEPTRFVMDTEESGTETYSDDERKKPVDTDVQGDVSLNESDVLQPCQRMEELSLGHVSQSHYVSLRHIGWHDRLFEVLRNKQVSCLVGSNPDSKQIDSNGDVSVGKEVISVSSEGLNYFLNYLKRGDFIMECNMKRTHYKSGEVFHYLVSDYCKGFEFIFRPKCKMNQQREQVPGYYLSTPADTVIVKDAREGNTKDLVIRNENCNVGQFRLVPILPKVWLSKLHVCGNLTLLKHVGFNFFNSTENPYVIAFKCKSWPEDAMEWVSRDRPSGWPSNSTVEEITEYGIRVTPVKERYSPDRPLKCNNALENVTTVMQDGVKAEEQIQTREDEDNPPTNDGSDLIWEYNFDISEDILCERGVHTEGKMLYYLLSVVTNFIFERKDMITNTHLKVLTFLVYERFSAEEIEHEPGKCVMYAIETLTDFLQKKHFPHYFIRGKNLIADMRYQDIVWHLERLRMLKTNIFGILYHVLDFCTLQNVCDVGKVFDGLADTAVERGLDISGREMCLLPLCVTAVTNCAKSKHFIHVKTQIDTWLNELTNTYGQSMISRAQFVHEILSDMYSKEQWLLAFYLDCIDGSEYVKYVCKGKSCVQLHNLFGDEVARVLCNETHLASELVLVPTSVIGECMVDFAVRLGEVLELDVVSTRAFQSAAHFFLKENAHDILLSVEKDQKDSKGQYSHVRLSDLKKLFSRLYDSYNRHNVWMFRELMELYDELCNFTATAHDFDFLAQLWEYFGENGRAHEALMKATSVRNDTVQVNCEANHHDVPHTHFTFAIKYIRMSEAVYCPKCNEDFTFKHGEKDTVRPEVYFETYDTMNGFIYCAKQSKLATKSKLFLVPTDSRVYNSESRGKAGIKDLLFDFPESSSSSTKLRANVSRYWINSLDDTNCLKHLVIPPSMEYSTSKERKLILSFQSEWPTEYDEWLTRKRVNRWPKPEVVDLVKKEACRVIPESENLPEPLGAVGWKVVFDKAEQLITEHSVTEEQKDCFVVVKLLIENNIDMAFTFQQMKHVFFYMCEETEDSLWKYEFATCVQKFLCRLKKCLLCRNIPNYFVPNIELFEDRFTDENVSKCIEYFDIVQQHPFVALFFTLDNCSDMFQSINVLFDSVIEDSFIYAVNKDIFKSLNLCFLPLAAEGVQSLVRRNKYQEAFERCKKATRQLQLLVPENKDIDLEGLIDEVIVLSNDKLQQWMFAFLVDQELGTSFIEFVCEGLPVVSVVDYYGPSLANHLRAHTGSGNTLIPEELVTMQNLAQTTINLLESCKNSWPKDVCDGVIKYFCRRQLVPLMQYTFRLSKSAPQAMYIKILLNTFRIHFLESRLMSQTQLCNELSTKLTLGLNKL